VKPDDNQCFRCGESLQDNPPPVPKGPELAHLVTERPEVRPMASREVAHEASERRPPVKAAREQDRHLELKEHELAEKEKAIVASVEQLEDDTRSLEDAIKRFDRDDEEMRERENILKQRELQLESLANKLEEAISQLETKPDSAGDIERLKQLSEDYSTRIGEERKRQKAQLDRDIEERLERLKNLQAFMAAAAAVSSTPREVEEPEPVQEERRELTKEEVAQAVAQLGKELEGQFGTPLQHPETAVISTKDERLDFILGGGIPVGHVVIVNGPAGTMKSTLSYYILHRAAVKSAKRSMYFSLEQKRDSLIRQMERMGMSLKDTAGGMVVVDMVDLRKATANEPGDWRAIMMRYVRNVHAQMPFDFFVLDSLESFKSMAQFEFTRESMKDLFDWFKELKITVLVITEKPIDILFQSVQGETYLADGVVELQMKEFDDAKVYRWLRCVKMRGMQNDSRYYAFYHTGTEFKFSLPLVDSGK